ncbi:MAG: MoxR family ATPase [Verrucomicrobiota bacterium]|nr:MoxR family ATPase [Verrucomicrobiota bacterium]
MAVGMQPIPTDPQQLSERIAQASQWVGTVKEEIARVLVGQEELVDRLLIGLICSGHILLEGMPGLAKTLSVKALAGTLNLAFARLQFTPDLLPADLVGTMIYNPDQRTFSPKLGPLFANIILADEINRAPAKVQSALLEAMQEKQVTLGDNSYPLPAPFLVLATQNPIDQEGTYQLPEAQLDRFLMKVEVTYPGKEEELLIMDRMASTTPSESTRQVVDPATIEAGREVIDQIYIDPAIREYIVDLVNATRYPAKIDTGLKPLLRAGASPRASINLALACRARAFMEGRSFVTPQDVKFLARDILRHRVLLSYEAEAEDMNADMLIERILSKVPVP